MTGRLGDAHPPARRLRRVLSLGQGGASRTGSSGPGRADAAVDLPRSGRPLPGLRLVPDLHRPAPGRRPPVARGGDDPARPPSGSRRRRSRRCRLLADLDPAGRRPGPQPADPRAAAAPGADPGRRRGRGPAALRADRAEPRGAGPRARAAARAVAARRLLRHRGRPLDRGRRPRVPARASPTDRRRGPSYLAALGPRPRRREGGLRGVHRPRHRPARARPRHARLPLRGLRDGRDQAADAASRAPASDEVDRLLRAGILVDLYNVVRQGLRASVESYSIKRIEKFYLPAADRARSPRPGSRVVAYETLAPRRRRASTSRDLADYNRDDCISTWMLRDWLEDRAARGDRPRLADGPAARSRTGCPARSQTAQQAETARRVEALTSGVPADRTDRDGRPAAPLAPRPAARLARPRRQAGVVELLPPATSSGVDDLIDSSEGLGGLVFEADIEPRGRGALRPPLPVPAAGPPDPGRTECRSSQTGSHGLDAGEVVDIDDIEGTIDLYRTASKLDHHPAALIPAKPIATDVLRDALRRIADDVLERGFTPTDGDRTFQTARDLVARTTPRLASAGGQPSGGPARPARRAGPWMPRSGSGSISTTGCFRSRDRPAAARPGPGPG